MDTLNNRRGLSVSGIMLAVAICGSFLALGAGAMGTSVPLNYRADTNAKIVNLKNFDALAPETLSSSRFNRDNILGTVRFENNTPVPVGYKLWFLDAGKQLVGLYILGDAGWYDMTNAPDGIYGDKPSTLNIDEGASVGDVISIITQTPANHFFETHFVDQLIFNGDGTPPALNYDITVKNNQFLATDTNNDCIVNILDLAAVGMAFGSSSGSGNWNPAADINVDGAVNIFDMASAGIDFGKSCNA